MNESSEQNWRCRGCWALGNNCGLCPECVRTRPAPPPLASVMLCANDRHGNADNYLRGVTFEMGGAGSLVELEPGREVMLRFCGDQERCEFKGRYKAAPHMLKVYGRGRLPVWRWAKCVGNMHWDAVGIPFTDLPNLLRWLALSDWRCHAGPTAFFEAFNENLNVTDMLADDYCAARAKVLG